MVRLLAKIDKLDLEQVRRTGERAKAGLEALAREHREIIRHVRGVGVMLGFDVVRPDWSDPLRDRAFRRGLLLLPAGERAVRFYPRYDTEPSADRRGAVDSAGVDRGSRGRPPCCQTRRRHSASASAR